MGVGVFPGQIVTIVGCDQGQTEFPGEFNKSLIGHILFGKKVFLQLEIETVIVENAGHLLGAALGLGHLTLIDQGRNLTTETGGHGNQTFVALGQKLPVDTGLVVETFTIGRRHQMAEVTVAGKILTKQHEMIRGVRRTAGTGLVKPGPGRYIDLATEDRLDAGGFGLAIELHGTKHVTVIGHRQGRHLAGHGALDQVTDLDGAIKKAVLTMKM